MDIINFIYSLFKGVFDKYLKKNDAVVADIVSLNQKMLDRTVSAEIAIKKELKIDEKLSLSLQMTSVRLKKYDESIPQLTNKIINGWNRYISLNAYNPDDQIEMDKMKVEELKLLDELRNKVDMVFKSI